MQTLLSPSAPAGVLKGSALQLSAFIYAVIFNPLGLRKTNSGSVREPTGNGLCFLRKNLTLASSTFTLQSRLDS